MLVAADLWLTPPYMRRVRSQVSSGDPAARVRTYELLVALAWAAAVAAVALLLIGGVPLAAAGLRLPDRDG